MKAKILKAIDKGLLNILSADITDHDIDFNHDDINSEYVPYEYRTVDMGTGILWCEYNLGAYPGNKASDWYGDYYAWGEDETKDNYSWETYKHCKGVKDTLTKYNETDMLKRLEPKDDVVTQTLGNKFRIPTKEAYEKLIDNTTNECVKNYKNINGLNGILFTAENSNTLFFPATGYCYSADRYGVSGYGSVWSDALCSDNLDNAHIFNFFSDGATVDNGSRYIGLPARGVQPR